MYLAIKGYIYKIVKLINEFIPLTISNLRKLVFDIKNFRVYLKNIVPNNINLGIYHLKIANYNDGLFRFRFVTSFLDKTNKEAHYWLGVTYFLKGELEKASKIINIGKEYDKINLIEMINNFNKTELLNDELIGFLRDFKAPNYLLINNDINNLAQIIVKNIQSHASKIPENPKILDINAGIYKIGEQLKKRLPEVIALDAIEISEELFKTYGDNKIYENNYNKSLNKFLAENKQKYDIVVSENGLSYQSDLTSIFHKIYKILNKSGILVFSYINNDETKFSLKQLEFTYNEQEIISQLQATNLQILANEKFLLETGDNYIIVICTK